MAFFEGTFAAMQLRRELRPYERTVVERVGTLGAHVVLPADSGKPLIGLELIRRLGQPAVVFGPTVAAQLSWQRALSQFADPAGVTALSSLDAQVLAPITMLTWDDLVPSATAEALIAGLVRDEWAAELCAAGRAPHRDAALERIERWERHNPRKVARTLAVKRAETAARLLRPAAADLAGIPPKTGQLADTLAAHGVRTIVLDGCDRLSDGRAILLRSLVQRLRTTSGPPTVIAMSALPRTIPGAHRHCRHLAPGETFEVPAPPVVHAGHLAPYRDLVYIVEPNAEERGRLATLHGDNRRARKAVGDLLGGSPEKTRAAVEILANEHVARPSELRAVVLTDREGGDDATRPGGLPPRSGTASAMFTRLLLDPRGQGLAPVLLTGNGLVAPTGPVCDALVASCKATVDRLGLRVRLRRAKTSTPRATAIVGKGEDWSVRTAAMLVTRAMSSGVTRCLVGGADGVLGEGADALEFDTLIDLTSVPSVSAARLRSRALPIEPSDERKVVHFWNVVACDPAAALGTLAVLRLRRRFEDRWGLALDEGGGRVVRGAGAIDQRLAAADLDGLRRVDYRAMTARCLAQIGDRDLSRRRWAVGSSSNVAIVTSVDAAEVTEPYRLGALLPHMRVPLALAVGLGILLAVAYLAPIPTPVRIGVQVGALAMAALVGATARQAIRLLRLTRGSPEARLTARGHAVLEALRDAGQVTLQLTGDAVRVRRTAPQNLEVRLGQGTDRDAKVFATALAETLAPLNGQPFVVTGGMRPVPVPTSLSADPSVFLEHWRFHLGAGRLVAAEDRPVPPPHDDESGGAVALEIWEPGAPQLTPDGGEDATQEIGAGQGTR